MIIDNALREGRKKRKKTASNGHISVENARPRSHISHFNHAHDDALFACYTATAHYPDMQWCGGFKIFSVAKVFFFSNIHPPTDDPTSHDLSVTYICYYIKYTFLTLSNLSVF